MLAGTIEFMKSMNMLTGHIISRRSFLTVAALSLDSVRSLTENKPVRFGYAAITWGGDDAQAIKDVSEVGFRGIQLRSNAVKEFGKRPEALRDALEQRHLEMVALSSGNVGIATGTEADEISKHTRHAQFVRDVGGHYLQLIDSARPDNRPALANDYKRLGRVMTEIGRRAVDMGIKVAYHNHMGSLGQSPDDIERIMSETDIHMLLDVAHYAQGGGDPVEAIRKYRDRHLFFHIKDVQSPVPGDTSNSYRFVELGRGRVNLRGVFAALEEIKFRGWAVVELDSAPDGRSPKESAVINKRYIEETLKIKV